MMESAGSELLVGPALALAVARAQSGHRASLDRVLRSVQEPLFHHIRLIVRDDALAEDVLQDALWLVARKLATLRDPRWFRPWAYRIATREAVRRSRAERAWRASLADDEVAGLAEPPVDEPVFSSELLAALPAHLDALSPASALVVRLHYLEQLTFVEIAEALEIPVGTVKSRLAYGLAALRRTMRLSAEVSGNR